MDKKCPGCGVVLPESHAPDSPFNASPECWELYCKLSVYTISLGDKEFLHQHAVDAYEAQHAGVGSKPISTVFGLIGLYLALERNYTGKKVQETHKILADRHKGWPVLPQPKVAWSLTVADVLKAEPGHERRDKIKEWARTVWAGWKNEQPAVRSLTEKYLFNR